MIYNNILGTIGKTPIVAIQRLAPKHVTMYVKCEFFNPLGSVKDRLAIAIIEDAERSGALKPGQTVVEATSGNTGIALAMVCAAKGYPFVATMAESFSVERRRIMRIMGAKVILTPAAERGSGMVRKAAELAKKHGWFLARQFENEANPAYHRNTTGPEILQDFAGRRLDYFVTGWGTGGTLTGRARCCGWRGRRCRSSPRSRRVRRCCRASRHAAQDPGLDAGLRAGGPEARSAAPDRDGDGYGGGGNCSRAGAQRGHFLRHLLGRDVCRSGQGRRRGSPGRGDSRHAPGHRGALPVHGAVRRDRRGRRSGALEHTVGPRSMDARQYASLPDPFPMWRGGVLHGARIAYETWGELNAARDNALLLFTGLSPPAHAASSPADPSDGWWQGMVGPRLAIDTERLFVICVNSLGSCFGSSGPASIDAATGKPYRLTFPDLSVEDIARAGFETVRSLGIERLDTLMAPRSGAWWCSRTPLSSPAPRGGWCVSRGPPPRRPSLSRCARSSAKRSPMIRTGGAATTAPSARRSRASAWRASLAR